MILWPILNARIHSGDLMVTLDLLECLFTLKVSSHTRPLLSLILNNSHLLLVLKRLREHGLYAKLEKCTFECNQEEFLGYVISSKGISMDPAKVKTVVEWQTPGSLWDVQCFLGFANFYRKFIQHYSKLILPLTQLTRKGQSFVWSEEADMSFKSLKNAFVHQLQF